MGTLPHAVGNAISQASHGNGVIGKLHTKGMPVSKRNSLKSLSSSTFAAGHAKKDLFEYVVDHGSTNTQEQAEEEADGLCYLCADIGDPDLRHEVGDKAIDSGIAPPRSGPPSCRNPAIIISNTLHPFHERKSGSYVFQHQIRQV